MAEKNAQDNVVKKVATRESYGNALKELAEEFPELVVLDRYFQEGVPGPPHRLRYCRGEYDGHCGGLVPDRQDSLCELFRHVCGGACL